MPESRSAIFRKLLTALWLRPESALWYSHMLSEAQSFGADRLPRPAVEFGAMDGLNGFVLLGGDVDFRFDVFQEVEWSYDAHLNSTLRNDYYDRVNEVNDIWKLNKAPVSRFDYGIDWKASHLGKARRAQAHDKLILWDPGTPLGMFEDRSIGGI